MCEKAGRFIAGAYDFDNNPAQLSLVRLLSVGYALRPDKRLAPRMGRSVLCLMNYHYCYSGGLRASRVFLMEYSCCLRYSMMSC